MKIWNRNDVIEKMVMDAREGIKDGQEINILIDPISTVPGGVEINTRYSRNSRYSNNGGDYYFWTSYTIVNGVLWITDCCSCDFWQPDNSIGPVCPMTFMELNHILRDVRAMIS